MNRLGLASGVLLSVVLLLVLSLPASVSAADIHDPQEDISLVVEQGGSAEFVLLVFNTESDDALFADGEIEDWVTFGEGHLAVYECENRAIDWIKVTIDVPRDTEIGEYYGEILSDGGYSDVIVRVVPLLDEIEDMEGAEDLSEELSSTKAELQEKSEEISQYQQDVADLEAELAGLRGESQDLKESNNQLTGQVAGGGPVQVIAGMIIGIAIVLLYLGRAGVAKTLRGVRRPGGSGSDGGYKGWKPS